MKYKHAMEVIENWTTKVEKHFGGQTWSRPEHESPDNYSLQVLNNPKCFRIKREPRRVWVNYCNVETVFESKELALMARCDLCDEVAVEFVEVIKA